MLHIYLDLALLLLLRSLSSSGLLIASTPYVLHFFILRIIQRLIYQQRRIIHQLRFLVLVVGVPLSHGCCSLLDFHSGLPTPILWHDVQYSCIFDARELVELGLFHLYVLIYFFIEGGEVCERMISPP